MPNWIKRIPWLVWALAGVAWTGLAIWELSQPASVDDHLDEAIRLLVGVAITAAAIGLVRPFQNKHRDSATGPAQERGHGTADLD
ncbi:hypothetical protein [Nonomuraea zeae]|uniref:Uncharacterized protein n=1 Tax=Nonomuraea zeae TaxID=1642303 RepID=A0A5S4GWW5_9ACTN|nr:hypothetical protein [Nonomuraea zeae]TMR37468.1 hypothetical protein ETD85_07715 [Nonomuraea zeae]